MTRRRLDFRDHRRELGENRYVYAVVSRRARGLSIGVNLNPDKACNFDCPYCQVDRTTPGGDRRIDVAREWVRRWSVVLVLKGAPTVIASPDGRARVNATGNPGLASAGTGDVLTGMIASLLAQGLAPADAACLAVHPSARR